MSMSNRDFLFWVIEEFLFLVTSQFFAVHFYFLDDGFMMV